MASSQTSNLLGYLPRDTQIHRLSGVTKLISFILLSAIGMISYDTRFLISLALFGIIIFKLADIRYDDIRLVIRFILVFAILNLLTIYLFAPEYGVDLYGTRHVIWEGIGRYTITQEQLFYEFNLMIKYFVTIPPGLIFFMTTNPSELAASLNRIGISYRISYAVALALRYIPDLQREFKSIAQVGQARGTDLSKDAPLMKRIKGNLTLAIPLIFSSLDRIDTISSAMELRRFGKLDKRTWYMTTPLKKADIIAISIISLIVLVGLWLILLNQGRFYNPFV